MVDLGQACLRVSDLMFTKRSALATAFREEAEYLRRRLGVPGRETPTVSAKAPGTK